MLFKKTSLFYINLIIAILFISSQALMADTSNKSPTASTTHNTKIDTESLQIQLNPMTKEELFVEADGWLLVLQKAAQKVAQTKLKIRADNTKIDQEKAEAGTKISNDSDATKAEKHKESDLSQLKENRTQRKHIIKRFNIVLEEINRKIGLDENGQELAEVHPYRLYINTVGGIKLDLTDSTSAWAGIKGYLLSEDGGMQWIVNAVIFIAILFAFWILSKVLSNAVKKALSLSKSNSTILNDFFINSIRRLTNVIGILVALSAVGISVAPIMAIIGAAGFVVAFALQGTLSNFASGIMIMLYRPFDVGNLVEVAGIVGKVESMTLVSTTIMTADNKLMIVPNNSIWGDVITNAHFSKERRVDMVFGIGYDDDMEQAAQVMNKVLNEHPLVLETPKPTVQVSELADSSVNFICRPWVKTADYWTVYWDVTRMVKEQFDAANISIPYPQTDIHIHQQTQETNQPQLAQSKATKQTANNQINEIDAHQDD